MNILSFIKKDSGSRLDYEEKKRKKEARILKELA